MKSYIVVGGGLAGLTASIELAHSGHQVHLYEQTRALGGRASTQAQPGGFAMNLGPHGFYRAGVMRRQFDAWGLAYTGRPPGANGCRQILFANRQAYHFPASLTGLLRCGAFSLRDKFGIAQMFARLSRETAPTGETMHHWIARQSPRPHVRNFLSALTRLSTYAADLELLDAGAALAQVQMALKASVLYLNGGWKTLISALAAKAQALGVAIHVDCGVTAASPQGIEWRHGHQPADGIILAVAPHAVELLTGGVLPPLIPARAACLDLGLRRTVPHAAAFALGLEEGLYLSNHSLYASGLAPAGGVTVHVAKYLKQQETATRQELEQVADLGMPGWREEVQVSRFLPEMTVVHGIPAAARPRPSVDALGMGNVYIAGDWVGSEGMLADCAVASGLGAARRLMQ